VFDRSERALIRHICDQVDAEARVWLPCLPALVFMTAEDGRWVIPEYGTLGMATGPAHIRWRVDSARPDGVLALARSTLRATLYHELHHIARRAVLSTGRKTLLDRVVTEGLATAFERDCAGHRAPWGDYPSNVQCWVDELLALPDDAPGAEWMFRHADGRRWIGYRAGTFLVDQAMACSRRSAADFVGTPSTELLALARPFG
jgi:hypothetical protein